MMLARFDPDSRLFYFPGVLLLSTFSCAAFLISPLSPLSSSWRQRILFLLPIAPFVGFALMAYFIPGHSAWDIKMNLGTCFAFGFAFSLDLWRHSKNAARAFGRVWTTVYILLFLSYVFFVPPTSNQ
jgi:hypothetical protein